MRTEQIGRSPKVYVIIFEDGDDMRPILEGFAVDHEILSAAFEGAGALERCTLGYFDRTTNDYRRIEIDAPVEVLSLRGTYSLHAGQPRLHASLIVAKSDGTAHGGHLLEGIVKPVMEVIVTESTDLMIRRWDENLHMPVIDV